MGAELGMGCWQLAGAYEQLGRPAGWGPMTSDQGIRLVHAALDHGIRFFDTAAAYGDGASERVLGRALEGRPGARVCTKVLFDGEPLLPRLEASLRRLRRERVDVLLLHGPPDDTPWDQVDPTELDQVVEAGLVGEWGISARGLLGGRAFAAHHPSHWVQWVLNPLERRPIEVVLPHVQGRFIARTPLGRGLLSARSLQGSRSFSTDDIRSTMPADWVAWMQEQARELARSCGTERIADLALRYTLSVPGVGVVIPGLKTVAQIEAAVAARARGVTTDERAAVEALPPCYPPWSHE